MEFGFRTSHLSDCQNSTDWTYSSKLHKVYTKRRAPFPVKFHVSNPLPGCSVQAFLRYTDDHDDSAVRRCPTHVKEDRSCNETAPCHLLQSLHEDALHIARPKTKENSVVAPLHWSNEDASSSTIIYSMTCNSACVGGPNRRSMTVVFKLKMQRVVVGETELQIHVCEHPQEFRRREEIQFQEKGSIIGHRPASPAPDTQSQSPSPTESFGSGSGSPARMRSRSVSPSRSAKSMSGSPARSGSRSPASRFGSPASGAGSIIGHRPASPAPDTQSQSPSPTESFGSGSGSPARMRSRSVSPSQSAKSMSGSPARSGSRSPASRFESPASGAGSIIGHRQASPAPDTQSQSPSPTESFGSGSGSPARMRSRSVSPSRSAKSMSGSPARSGSRSPASRFGSPASGADDIFDEEEEEWKPPKKKRKRGRCSSSSSSEDVSDREKLSTKKRRKKQCCPSAGSLLKPGLHPCSSRSQSEPALPPCLRQSQSEPRQKRQTGCRSRKQGQTGCRSRKQTAANARKRFDCPVKDCKGKTVDLWKHFRNCHKDMTQPEVKQIISDSREPRKRSYHRFRCVQPGCEWTGTRPEKHLMSKSHNISCKREALAMAKLCERVDTDKTIPVGPVPPRRGLHTADSISKEFYDWYSSLEGGSYVLPSLHPRKLKKKENQNKRVQNMVKTVLQEIWKSDSFVIESLKALKMIGRKQNGEKSILEKLKEDRTWGTVKNFMIALGHFMKFIEVCYPHSQIDTAGMQTVFSGIMKTINKFVAEELQRRKHKGRSLLIPRETMETYLNKQLARKAIQEWKQNKTADNFKKIRNHLLLQTAFTNSKRTGILSDMTTTHVDNASTKGERKVVQIDDGKTYNTSGPAGVQFNADNFQLLCDYIKYVKPQSDSNQIFCKEDGSFAETSDINKFLQNAFEHFGAVHGETVPNVTCSIIRKSWVTLTRDADMPRETQRRVARHMDHTIGTSDRHYDISDGVKATVEFAEIVESFIPVASSANYAVAFAHSENEEELDSENKNTSSSEEELEMSPDIEAATGSKKPNRFGKQVVFDEEDLVQLRRCCCAYIEEKSEGGRIQRAHVIKLIQDAGVNFANLLRDYTQLQLYSRVRTEVYKAKKHRSKGNCLEALK